jgi:hypothetical protein
MGNLLSENSFTLWRDKKKSTGIIKIQHNYDCPTFVFHGVVIALEGKNWTIIH